MNKLLLMIVFMSCEVLAFEIISINSDNISIGLDHAVKVVAQVNEIMPYDLHYQLPTLDSLQVEKGTQSNFVVSNTSSVELDDKSIKTSTSDIPLILAWQAILDGEGGQDIDDECQEKRKIMIEDIEYYYDVPHARQKISKMIQMAHNVSYVTTHPKIERHNVLLAVPEQKTSQQIATTLKVQEKGSAVDIKPVRRPSRRKPQQPVSTKTNLEAKITTKIAVSSTVATPSRRLNIELRTTDERSELE